MKIPLNEISTPGLLRLLRDVAAELEARHSTPTVQHVHATRPVETLRVPPEDDADFCLMIAARMVLVDGMRQADAARMAGCSASALGNTLRTCRAGLELARLAAC